MADDADVETDHPKDWVNQMFESWVEKRSEEQRREGDIECHTYRFQTWQQQNLIASDQKSAFKTRRTKGTVALRVLKEGYGQKRRRFCCCQGTWER